MERLMERWLDGDDEEVGILILCACAYAALTWMTYLNDIGEPIPRHIREKFAYSFKIIADILGEEERVMAECYEQLRGMVGTQYNCIIFSEDVVRAAYDYLVEHPRIAKGFLIRRSADKACWLCRFIKNNNLD